MWKTLSSKEIFSHPRLTLIEDEVLLPNGHQTKYLRYKDGNRNVTIIVQREDGKILVSKEYSYPVNELLFQFPGGGILLDELLENGVRRELIEETSLNSNHIIPLGSYLINNRRSSDRMHVFLVKDVFVDNSLNADIEEHIENYWYTENEIDLMIRDGAIVNVHILASWSLYKAKK